MNELRGIGWKSIQAEAWHVPSKSMEKQREHIGWNGMSKRDGGKRCCRRGNRNMVSRSHGSLKAIVRTLDFSLRYRGFLWRLKQ